MMFAQTVQQVASLRPEKQGTILMASRRRSGQICRWA